MVAALGEAGADPPVGHCACLRRELSGEPDVGNLHLRFDEGRGTFSVPSYSTGSVWKIVTGPSSPDSSSGESLE